MPEAEYSRWGSEVASGVGGGVLDERFLIREAQSGDLEAINAGADRAVLANPLLTGDLEALARAYSGDRARAAFGAVDRALTALERNAGIKVVTEWLAVQM